ncbi:MAG: small subunit ribosomal protein S9 [Planctomycetota bacterium]|jgi:small subunit ribosomal protein S9
MSDTETTQPEVMPEKSITRRTLAKGEYIYAIGRRKTATAQVRMYDAKARKIVINGIDISKYFKTEDQRKSVSDPITKTKSQEHFEITAVVSGGGLHAQAEAIRHGVSRAMVQIDPMYRDGLKKLGFLKRDPRKKERKKFGLRGARRAPQWSKR